MKPFDSSAVYNIVAQGHIPETWKDAFGDLQIVETGANTILSGHLVDQTALQGILQNLYSLGLVLVNVNCVENSDQTPVNLNVKEEN